METFEQQLKKEAARLELSHEEKGAMRMALQEKMRTMPSPSAIPSPYRSWQWSPRSFAASSSFAMAVLLLSSTSYAAQGALPGDALYPIKVHVNEAISGALAVGDLSRAQWNADIAQTRVEEAQALAARGDLSSGAAMNLADNFSSHVAVAADLTERLQKDHAPEALQLSTELGATFSAQGAVLAQLGAAQNTTTKENSNALADLARTSGAAFSRVAFAPQAEAAPRPIAAAKASVMMMASEDNDANAPVAPTAMPSERVSARPASTGSGVFNAVMKSRAKEQLLGAKTLYMKMQRDLDASTTVAVQAKLSSAGAALSEGDAAAAAGASDVALEKYQSVLSISVELSTLLQANKQYPRSSLLSTLLNVSISSSTPAVLGGKKVNGRNPYRGGGEPSLDNGSSTRAAATTTAGYVLPPPVSPHSSTPQGTTSGDSSAASQSSGQSSASGNVTSGGDSGSSASGAVHISVPAVPPVALPSIGL